MRDNSARLILIRKISLEKGEDLFPSRIKGYFFSLSFSFFLGARAAGKMQVNELNKRRYNIRFMLTINVLLPTLARARAYFNANAFNMRCPGNTRISHACYTHACAHTHTYIYTSRPDVIKFILRSDFSSIFFIKLYRCNVCRNRLRLYK